VLERRVLFASDVVQISEVRCRAGKSGCGDVEREATPRLILPREGAFAYHFSPRDEIVADANTAIVLHPQMDFKISHPIDGGDCCTVFDFRDEAVLEPLHGAVVADARAILAAHIAQRTPHRLAAEEHAIACVDALHNAFATSRQSGLVERAKASIAEDPFDDRSLAEIARAVGSSPFHLTRSFKRATGLSLHAYRMQLRLQASLDRLHAGDSLARVAVDCGFAHHSHFTAAFRKHFGTAPAELRKISIAP
jgi:AraC family transcriptional regulator